MKEEDLFNLISLTGTQISTEIGAEPSDTDIRPVFLFYLYAESPGKAVSCTFRMGQMTGPVSSLTNV